MGLTVNNASVFISDENSVTAIQKALQALFNYSVNPVVKLSLPGSARQLEATTSSSSAKVLASYTLTATASSPAAAQALAQQTSTALTATNATAFASAVTRQLTTLGSTVDYGLVVNSVTVTSASANGVMITTSTTAALSFPSSGAGFEVKAKAFSALLALLLFGTMTF